MLVTPKRSELNPSSVFFEYGTYPVFFQRGFQQPLPGVEVEVMITKCIYARDLKGSLDMTKLRFMVASPVSVGGLPDPIKVPHSGFYPLDPSRPPSDSNPSVAFVSSDVFVNEYLVARVGEPITSGALDLWSAPGRDKNPGEVYVRRRKIGLVSVGTPSLEDLRFFSRRA